MALVVNVKCYPLLTESIGFPAVVYIYRDSSSTFLDEVIIVVIDPSLLLLCISVKIA